LRWVAVVVLQALLRWAVVDSPQPQQQQGLPSPPSPLPVLPATCLDQAQTHLASAVAQCSTWVRLLLQVLPATCLDQAQTHLPSAVDRCSTWARLLLQVLLMQQQPAVCFQHLNQQTCSPLR